MRGAALIAHSAHGKITIKYYDFFKLNLRFPLPLCATPQPSLAFPGNTLHPPHLPIKKVDGAGHPVHKIVQTIPYFLGAAFAAPREEVITIIGLQGWAPGVQGGEIKGKLKIGRRG